MQTHNMSATGQTTCPDDGQKSSRASTNKSSNAFGAVPTKRNYHSSCATTLGSKSASRHGRSGRSRERKLLGDTVSSTWPLFLQRIHERWEARQGKAQGILDLQREAGKAS